MGLDLKVYPIHYQEPETVPLWYGFDSLTFDRSYELFAQLGDLTARGFSVPRVKTEPFPAGRRLWLLQNEGAAETDTDAYGDRLTFTRRLYLRELRLPEEMTDWNRAVVAFLRALPDLVPVVLWWC